MSKKKIAAGKKSLWIKALREWNRGNESWCVPKENTPEYNKCIEILQRLQAEAEEERQDDLPLTKFVAQARAKTRNTQQDADDVPLTEFVPQTKAATAIQRAWRNRHFPKTQQDATEMVERYIEKRYPGQPSAFGIPWAYHHRELIENPIKSTNRVKLLNVFDVYRTQRDKTLDRMQKVSDGMALVRRDLRNIRNDMG